MIKKECPICGAWRWLKNPESFVLNLQPIFPAELSLFPILNGKNVRPVESLYCLLSCLESLTSNGMFALDCLPI